MGVANNCLLYRPKKFNICRNTAAIRTQSLLIHIHICIHTLNENCKWGWPIWHLIFFRILTQACGYTTKIRIYILLTHINLSMKTSVSFENACLLDAGPGVSMPYQVKFWHKHMSILSFISLTEVLIPKELWGDEGIKAPSREAEGVLRSDICTVVCLVRFAIVKLENANLPNSDLLGVYFFLGKNPFNFVHSGGMRSYGQVLWQRVE